MPDGPIACVMPMDQQALMLASQGHVAGFMASMLALPYQLIDQGVQSVAISSMLMVMLLSGLQAASAEP